MSRPADPDVDTLRALAAEHRDQHRYVEASALYARVLAIDERQPVLSLLGAIQNPLGDPAAAVTTLTRSLALDPADDEAHFHLGIALHQTDLAAALAHFQQAIAIDAAPASYHREAAIALWRLERFDEALPVIERAIARNPNESFAHHALGLIQQWRGDLGAALDAYQAAAALEPDCGLFWASAGRVAARAGRADEARRCLQRAIDLDAGDARSRRDLATLTDMEGIR